MVRGDHLSGFVHRLREQVKALVSAIEKESPSAEICECAGRLRDASVLAVVWLSEPNSSPPDTSTNR